MILDFLIRRFQKHLLNILNEIIIKITIRFLRIIIKLTIRFQKIIIKLNIRCRRNTIKLDFQKLNLNQKKNRSVPFKKVPLNTRII